MPMISSPDLIGRALGGRKLVTVTFMDMVNYSRLIGLDDIGTFERLQTLRRALIDPTIAEHGGRIVSTAGDSLFIEFDSIDGAVRCAVVIQRQVPDYDGDQAVSCSNRHHEDIVVEVQPFYYLDLGYFKKGWQWLRRMSSVHSGTSEQNWRECCFNLSNSLRSSAQI